MIYVGPYPWSTNEPHGQPCYAPPAWSKGTYDLRSLAECGSPNVAGDAIFIGPDSGVPLDYIPLGDAKNDTLSVAAKNRLGVTSSRLGAAMMERLIEGADDTGTARNFPLLPGRDGRIRAAIGRVDFDIAPDRAASWWPVVRRTLRRIVAVSPRPRQTLHTLLERNLMVPVTREKAIELLELDESPEKPSTTIVDNFNRSTTEWVSNTLGTSSDASFTWAYDSGAAGQWYIGSGGNANRVYALLGGNAIADYSFASADHYAQIIQRSAAADLSPRTRVASNSGYFTYRASGSSVQLYKRVTGTDTFLVSWSITAPVNGDTVKLDSTGNTHTLYINGASVASQSDSSLPSNLKTGLGTYTNGPYGDDFEASDGAVSLVVDWMPLHHLLPQPRRSVIAY